MASKDAIAWHVGLPSIAKILDFFILEKVSYVLEMMLSLITSYSYNKNLHGYEV